MMNKIRKWILRSLGILNECLDRPPSYERTYGGEMTNLAIVGCGFVAEAYARSLRAHPELKLIGVTDLDAARAARMSEFCGCEIYRSLNELLMDDRIQVVLNLTNPKNHYDVSKACLIAGKHVYSEKPLAMTMTEAETLVELGEEQKLYISSAPCSILGESARAFCKALREGEIGESRIVYAEMEDGPIHLMRPDEWKNSLGTPWPREDEFSSGCVIEHAGYLLTWLVAMFGAAKSVTAFSSCLIPDKMSDQHLGGDATDFSVACIRFKSGVVARLTCGIIAPRDHSIRVVGDDGVLSVDDCWHYEAPVRLRKFTPLSFQAESYPFFSKSSFWRSVFGLNGKEYPLASKRRLRYRFKKQHMDFACGVVEMSRAIKEKRSSRLNARFCLHVNELTLAIRDSLGGRTVELKTTCEPMEL